MRSECKLSFPVCTTGELVRLSSGAMLNFILHVSCEEEEEDGGGCVDNHLAIVSCVKPPFTELLFRTYVSVTLKTNAVQ